MNTFVEHVPQSTSQMPYKSYIKTHPSVRIKGTETTYNPMQCLDPLCANKNPHMHCPFCVKTDSYQDPVILKAHYRVKHVDKGIEFAGLKILRCCDHCDIVGIIKGEKKFKGAHWHCYKCRNGFNRRDEAIKHYKTHFRNPQTTFQIQITQEVNQIPNLNAEDQAATHTISQGDMSIHPVLTEAAVMSTTVADDSSFLTRANQAGIANGKGSEGTVHVSVAANETVDTTDSSQTIMIIKEDLTNMNNSFTTQIISSEDLTILEDKSTSLDKNYLALQEKYKLLQMEKSQLEQQMKAEIEQLKIQLQIQSQAIISYQKREQMLMNRLSSPGEKNIRDLIKNLETQHRELLNQQLTQLRQAYIAHLPQDIQESISNAIINQETSPQDSIISTSSSALISHHIDVNGGSSGHHQQNLAYLTNKVVARLQTSTHGHLQDDIVIITAEQETEHSGEQVLTDQEPLIICAETVEKEATLDVNCSSDDDDDGVRNVNMSVSPKEQEANNTTVDAAGEPPSKRKRD